MNSQLLAVEKTILQTAHAFRGIESQHRIRVVMLGGAAVPFYIDASPSTTFRKTKDIDVAAAARTYSDFQRLENILRQHHFQADLEIDRSPLENRLSFRWWLGDLCIDFLNAYDINRGNDVRWLDDESDRPWIHHLHDGTPIWLASPPSLIATKLDAFLERGKSDFLVSHDLEDILTVIWGRPQISEEIHSAPQKLRAYLTNHFARFLKQPEFHMTLDGQFPGSSADVAVLLERITQIAQP